MKKYYKIRLETQYKNAFNSAGFFNLRHKYVEFYKDKMHSWNINFFSLSEKHSIVDFTNYYDSLFEFTVVGDLLTVTLTKEDTPTLSLVNRIKLWYNRFL